MEPLPRIPVPLRQRWREFRVAYLPPLTFALLVVGIAWMWTRYVHPANIVGEVESVHANVVSLLPGTLTELAVDRFQRVTNGQEVARLAVIEPDLLNAELAAVEADVRLQKSRLDLEKQRAVDSYNQQRLGLLAEKITLELTRIRLQQADSEFQRVRQLYTNNIIAKGLELGIRNFAMQNSLGYDVAVRDRDLLQTQLATQANVVAQMEKNLRQFETGGVTQVAPVDALIEADLQAQQQRLAQLHKPVVLKAPIDGFVSLIHHRPGEKVPAGTPILVISPSKSDRIIGWVRQPVRVRPAVGDVVQVRLNRTGQPVTDAVVTEVGGQMEPISLTALPINTPPNHVEVGLQFMVKAPAGADLIPGEAVEMYLQTRTRGRNAN